MRHFNRKRIYVRKATSSGSKSFLKRGSLSLVLREVAYFVWLRSRKWFKRKKRNIGVKRNLRRFRAVHFSWGRIFRSYISFYLYDLIARKRKLNEYKELVETSFNIINKGHYPLSVMLKLKKYYKKFALGNKGKGNNLRVLSEVAKRHIVRLKTLILNSNRVLQFRRC